MKTNRSLESGQLPKYMSRATGAAVQGDWSEHGKCKPHTEVDLPRFAWLVVKSDPPTQGHKAQRWIDLARTICESCPAQYDCVAFAIQVDERYGTWGLAQDELSWLKKQEFRHGLIEAAREVGVSVHQAVVRARRFA